MRHHDGFYVLLETYLNNSAIELLDPNIVVEHAYSVVDIDIENDVEIFYYYRPSYNADDTNFSNFKKLDAATVLMPCQAQEDDNMVSISGLFNLKLPMSDFGKKGIYNIYIRPK